ncbi:hypothetical protein BWZ31_12645, partial [Neisseria meningitidis]
MCHSKKVSRTAIIKEIAGISIVGVTTGLVGILTTLLSATYSKHMAPGHLVCAPALIVVATRPCVILKR